VKERVSVIGAGTWGATLADLLARQGHAVTLWEFFPAAADALRAGRKLPVLPQLKLHDAVRVTSDLNEALDGARVAVSAVPSEFVRNTWRAVQKSGAWPRDAWVVSVTKGIENETFKRMSEVIVDELPAAQRRVAALTGPSHAEEVAGGLPTAIVAAGPAALAAKTQQIFTTDNFRVYTSDDLIGVEIGGAVKNIYAVACGIADGLGLGDNTKAAVMTRGLNEMARLGVALGAKGATFFGLAGVGDLIVTCGSRHSRNRSVGEKIGRGMTLRDALAEMKMVAEGVPAAQSVHALAWRLKVDMPIVNEIYHCLFEGKSAKESLRDLMVRPVSAEMTHVEHIFA